ncbi:MAG TPA: hypothetical protein VIA62_11410 [Thermoanaerobaculia bacterium]|nr:hypothetical protein [Thermoanaerobaculia bacterium]
MCVREKQSDTGRAAGQRRYDGRLRPPGPIRCRPPGEIGDDRLDGFARRRCRGTAQQRLGL